MKKYTINIGDTYNSLTVQKIYKENNVTCYQCLCKCGKTKIVIGANKLVNGSVKSCGCATGEKCAERNRANRKYTLTQNDRLRDIWRQMHQRCENPKHISYPYYGAKGVSVCKEWDEYETFAIWALSHGYEDNLTIDRINSDKGYFPDNCRWATYKVQNNNSSRCHYITYKGKTQSMTAWAEELGLSRGVIKDRIERLGWSIEDALMTPIMSKFGPQREKKKALSCSDV